MIPVDQTVFGARGNCYAACLASLLERSVGDVPDLRRFGDDWGNELRNWLLAAHGVLARFTAGDRRLLSEQADTPPGWSILSGRFGCRPVHAVVCEGGKIVHDPAPFPNHADPAVVLWTTFEGLP